MSFKWETKTLGEICLKITDGAHASPASVLVGKAMASVKDLTRFGVDLSRARLIANEDFDVLEKQGCKPQVGDVLIAKDGNSALDTVCTVTKPLDAVLLSSVAILRPNPVKVNAEFLKYYLSCSNVTAYLKSNFISGAAIPRVVLRDFKKAIISLPPMETQTQIASILNALDDRLALLRETNATLEAIAQTIFKSWFVDFDPVRAKQEGRIPDGMDEATAALFPESLEQSEFGAVPRGWHSATLGGICSESGGAIQTGPFGSQLHASDYRDAGVPVVMPQDLAERRVQVDKIARVGDLDANRLIRHQLQRGDIVFSRRGDVGRHALVGEREVGWLCGTGCLLVRPGPSWPSFMYLSLALDRAVAKEWLLRHAVGATMPNLNTGILNAVPIMRPDNRILQAFNGIVSALDERISHGHANVRTLVELRDTLLPRLISGQLRLPDAHALLKEAA